MPKIPQPWHPAVWDADDVQGVKRMAEQHPKAMRFVIEQVCGTYDETYFPDSERNSAYAQGKRKVGMELVKFINLPSSVLDLERAKASSKAKSRK